MKIEYLIADQGTPEILIQPLEPVLNKLSNKGYHKCWAHQFSILNKFYVRSFYDYDFTILPVNNGIEVINNEPALQLSFNKLSIEKNDMAHENKPVLQMPPGFIFLPERTCFIELQQSFYGPKEMKLIPGKFDIFKWQRPVKFAFELDFHKRIKINKGDILCEIAFYTNKINESIKLNFIKNPDKSIIEKAMNNANISGFIKHTKNLINNIL